MDSFWENSWVNVGLDRIQEYVGKNGMEEDALIKVLHEHNANEVCDAGCGCGVYTAKLAANRFHVSAFDVSKHAVGFAQRLLAENGFKVHFKTASILETGYEDGLFDAVVSKDVLDHMCKADASKAVIELLRITKQGGIVLFTLDTLDAEYVSEPHVVNLDGDYVYTSGKWKGMVFHPYTPETVLDIVPPDAVVDVISKDGDLVVLLEKRIGMDEPNQVTYEAMEAVEKGSTYGPFNNVDELMDALND